MGTFIFAFLGEDTLSFPQPFYLPLLLLLCLPPVLSIPSPFLLTFPLPVLHFYYSSTSLLPTGTLPYHSFYAFSGTHLFLPTPALLLPTFSHALALPHPT